MMMMMMSITCDRGFRWLRLAARVFRIRAYLFVVVVVVVAPSKETDLDRCSSSERRRHSSSSDDDDDDDNFFRGSAKWSFFHRSTNEGVSEKPLIHSFP